MGFGESEILKMRDVYTLPSMSENTKAAHVVAIQAFSAFAPLAILAMIRIPEDGYPNILAMTFFIGIFAHYVIYAIGITVLRTLSFSLAALSTLALGLRVLGFI